MPEQRGKATGSDTASWQDTTAITSSGRSSCSMVPFPDRFGRCGPTFGPPFQLALLGVQLLW